jgi:hydroxymethylpyrimidine/phosphomethylpyrimidine kinase
MDPLTPEEVQAASDRFFPLFDIILRNMPENSKVEDCLKVMESVCTLAHKMRLEEGKGVLPFGFNKQKQEEV